MKILEGMLSSTSRVFGEKQKKKIQPDFNQPLIKKGSDFYLQKIYVSCYLGSARKNYQQN